MASPIKVSDLIQKPGVNPAWDPVNNRGFDISQVNSINDLLTKGGFKIIPFVLFIIGMLFFTNLLIAAFEYVTSNGDPKKFASATSRFLNGFFGIVIVITSFLLLKIITTIIGQPDLLV